MERDKLRAREVARECNQFCAGLKRADPAAYGFFACMPDLFDTEGVLAELTRTFEEDDPDGVVLYTAYGAERPHYLGDDAFEPIWAELARRRAVVLVHPTHTAGATCVNAHLPAPLFDFPHETGRAAMDLVTSGMLRRHPGCKVILSHAGGTLPYLLFRVAVGLPLTPLSVGRSTQQLVDEARELYFDTALSTGAPTLRALFELTRPGHVLFGSDAPAAPAESVQYFLKCLDNFVDVPGGADTVGFGAALELFPRLKQYYSMPDRCS